MSVVKSLALGVSLMGSLVAPALARAGSIRGSHHTPERSHRAVLPDAPMPTTLAVAPASNVPPVLAAPAPSVSQENLAGFAASANSAITAYSAPAAALPMAPTAPLTLGVTGAAGTVAPVLMPTSTPASAAMFAPTSAATSGPTALHAVDAYLNFGQSAYSEAPTLTTGTPQSWTLSPAVQAVFHGTPTAAQQASFVGQVLAVVQGTYNLAGLPISLTTDPNANYAHTMSVVSGASYVGNPNAIGITDVGNDGFSFIDKFGQAQSPQELAMAIGHNIAHELMHAFGIASHPDGTGTFLDAASINWSTLTNAQTSFSPAATQMLAAQNFLSGPGKEFTQGTLGLTGLEVLTSHHPTFCNCPLCQAKRKLEASEGVSVSSNGPGSASVPEPTTVALWTVGLIGGLVIRGRHRSA